MSTYTPADEADIDRPDPVTACTVRKYGCGSVSLLFAAIVRGSRARPLMLKLMTCISPALHDLLQINTSHACWHGIHGSEI